MAQNVLPAGLVRLIGHGIADRLEALAFGCLMLLSRALGIERASKFGAFMMSIIGPALPKHHHVLQNLEIVMNEAPPEQIRSTARKVWGTLGSVMMEMPHLRTIVEKPMPARLSVCVSSDMSDYQACKRPAVFAAPHLGNWEVAGGVGFALGIPMRVVYSPARNGFINQNMQEYRLGLNCEFIEKSGAAISIARELKAGRSIGLVTDLRPEEGIEIPFFNNPALVPTAAIALACRFGADILPGRPIRLDGSHFRIVIEPPLTASRDGLTGDALIRDLTIQLFARFEQWIAETPDQWLCLKRRWPKPGKDKKHAKALDRNRMAQERKVRH